MFFFVTITVIITIYTNTYTHTLPLSPPLLLLLQYIRELELSLALGVSSLERYCNGSGLKLGIPEVGVLVTTTTTTTSSSSSSGRDDSISGGTSISTSTTTTNTTITNIDKNVNAIIYNNEMRSTMTKLLEYEATLLQYTSRVVSVGSQILTVVVSGILVKLSLIVSGDLPQSTGLSWYKYGMLVVFESLLSTSGNENIMVSKCRESEFYQWT